MVRASDRSQQVGRGRLALQARLALIRLIACRSAALALRLALAERPRPLRGATPASARLKKTRAARSPECSRMLAGTAWPGRAVETCDQPEPNSRPQPPLQSNHKARRADVWGGAAGWGGARAAAVDLGKRVSTTSIPCALWPRQSPQDSSIPVAAKGGFSSGPRAPDIARRATSRSSRRARYCHERSADRRLRAPRSRR